MFLDLSFLFSSCKVKIVSLQDKDHNKAINLPCMVGFSEGLALSWKVSADLPSKFSFSSLFF